MHDLSSTVIVHYELADLRRALLVILLRDCKAHWRSTVVTVLSLRLTVASDPEAGPADYGSNLNLRELRFGWGSIDWSGTSSSSVYLHNH